MQYLTGTDISVNDETLSLVYKSNLLSFFFSISLFLLNLQSVGGWQLVSPDQQIKISELMASCYL